MSFIVLVIGALAFLSIYSYFVYPLILLIARKTPLAARSKVHHRSHNHDSTMNDTGTDPKISLIITAHNEEDRIRAKIENSLLLA